MHRGNRWVAVGAILILCSAHDLSVRVADAKPNRPMVFLSRDAVVTESPEQMTLVNVKAGRVPDVVVGKPPFDADGRYETMQVRNAADTLRKWLEKITGAKLAEGPAGGLIPNRLFQQPALPKRADDRWESISGEWRAYHNPNTGVQVTRRERDRKGSYSVIIRGANPERAIAGVVLPLNLKRDVRYKLSIQYKMIFPSPAQAVVRVAHLAQPLIEVLPASRDWRLHETTFLMDNPKNSNATLIIGLSGSQTEDNRLFLTEVDLVEIAAGAPGEAETQRRPRIVVGFEGEPESEFPELKQADAHGFLIATKGSDLHVVGASGTGALYGAWFFLMNYAGLRLVLPGELGEIYEPLEKLAIPKDLYVLNPGPDFLLRVWSDPAGFDITSWLGDNGRTDRYQYHHNQMRIFDPARFAQTNPEFYPIHRGQRFIPAAGIGGRWQPTFSEPGVVQRTIEYADEWFTGRPDAVSVSVTVNDGDSFSETDLARAKTLPGGLSDVYYAYVNAVAKGIRQKWANKQVAFLPYQAVDKPPSFPLEDNTIAFCMNFEGNTNKAYSVWQDKVKQFGIYQWLYGAGWVIPNQWPHAMQDFLRWARDHGCRAFKGEGYIPWSQDAARMWVFNNLLWNTDADVDALLADYYQHCYGSSSAPAMARYFAQAEKIYERRRTSTEWNITRWKPGDYQFKFAQPEDFTIMAQALDDANRTAEGEGNRKRVDLTTRCFRYGRYYWEQYRAFMDLRGRVPESAATLNIASDKDAESIFEPISRFYKAQEDCRVYRDTLEPFVNYCCIAATPWRPWESWWQQDPTMKWGDMEADVLRICEAVTQSRSQQRGSAATAAYWQTIDEKHLAMRPFANRERFLLLAKDRPLQNLLSNGSFEQAYDPQDAEQQRTLTALQNGFNVDRMVSNNENRERIIEAARNPRITGYMAKYADKPEPLCQDWFTYHWWSKGATVALDTTMRRGGEKSMTAKGITNLAGVVRNVPVTDKRAFYRLSFWCRANTGKESPYVWTFTYGQKELPIWEKRLEPARDWRCFAREFVVNCAVDEKADFTFGLGLYNSGDAANQVWFDDVKLEKLSPEATENAGP